MNKTTRNFFEVGDHVLFGKFQNKHAIIVRLWTDDRGIPMIELEPFPKGRKKNRSMSLFRIRHEALPEVRVASKWLQGED